MGAFSFGLRLAYKRIYISPKGRDNIYTYTDNIYTYMYTLKLIHSYSRKIKAYMYTLSRKTYSVISKLLLLKVKRGR